MKTLFLRILSLFIAIQVLIASTGFVITEHMCRISGDTTYLFSKPETCHSNLKEKSCKAGFNQTKCCQDFSSYARISVNSANNSNNKLILQSPDFHEIKELCINSPIYLSINHYNSSLTSPTNKIPILAGKDLLIFIQTFLI
ncbi:hypothetical protein SAMN04515674_11727 [Pseudarcicella hirudinis]|uniref:Uncharacterized protein n=1 Tax=Pseudarcicella hirudinis TaxID=1079859 RepID=A0A1I5Y5S6_9BACT|nr:hypothetical protein [Pseudarcicella hirudinis]SFQ39504.1 hypothetical protein SAMN04515674_11727 [Pseudarcicella hirudinis]